MTGPRIEDAPVAANKQFVISARSPVDAIELSDLHSDSGYPDCSLSQKLVTGFSNIGLSRGGGFVEMETAGIIW